MFVLRIAFPSVESANKVEIVEWEFKDNPHDIKWTKFIHTLCEKTKLKKNQFYVFWHDGEEYCTINNTAGLRDAMRCMYFVNASKPPLLYVMPMACNKGQSTLTLFSHSYRVDKLPRDFREYVGKAPVEPESVYQLLDSVRCSECGKSKWKEDKYTCVVCSNVVFCDKCFPVAEHEDHPVLITRECSIYPNQLLEVVRRVATHINQCESSDEEETDSDDDQCCSAYSEGEPVDLRISLAVSAVKDMGFKHSERALTILAHEEDGNLESMVDRLIDMSDSE